MAELPPAPWETIPDAYNGKEELWGYFHGIRGLEVDFSGREVGKEAEFIVAMRNALPQLLDAATPRTVVLPQRWTHKTGVDERGPGFNPWEQAELGFWMRSNDVLAMLAAAGIGVKP
jgi:hypothetical protein